MLADLIFFLNNRIEIFSTTSQTNHGPKQLKKKNENNIISFCK